MMQYKRHEFIWLSDTGKDYALRNIISCVPTVSEGEKRDLIFSIPSIPCIVGRQERAEEKHLYVSFSSPNIIDGVRLRIGSKVPFNCIAKSKTPFDVVKSGNRHLLDYKALEALIETGNKYHIQVGCFGYTALQLITGLPYRNENSDLNIYIRHSGSRQELEQFYTRLSEYETEFNIKIDAEIEYLGEYGIKLKELFIPGKTIMAKGLYDVVLLEKTAFLTGSSGF